MAVGSACHPWLDRKSLSPELAVEEVAGAVYGLSRIDQELFYLWFTKHFLLYAPPACQLLLLMDGLLPCNHKVHTLLKRGSSFSHFLPTPPICPIGQGNLWATEVFLEASVSKILGLRWPSSTFLPTSVKHEYKH